MVEQEEWFWEDYVYTDEEVRKLSLIISSKATKKSLKKLQKYLKNTNSLKRREAQFLFLFYIAKCISNQASRKEYLVKFTAERKNFTLLYKIIKNVIKVVRPDITELQVDKILSSSNTLHLLFVVDIFHELCKGKDNQKVINVLHAMFPIYDAILDTYTIKLGTLKNDLDDVYNFENLQLSANLLMEQVHTLFLIKPHTKVNNYIIRLLNHSYKVLANDKDVFSMKFNCALIFVRCLDRLPDDEKKHFKYKKTPVLEVIKETNESTDWIRGESFCFEYTKSLNDDTVKASLYLAVYYRLRIKKNLNIMLKPENSDLNIFQVLLSEILSCTEGPISDDDKIVEISRCLWKMSKTLGKLQPADFHVIFKRCISYVNAFYDYHNKVIRDFATAFLERLIKISCEHFDEGSQDSMNNLLEYINFREGKRKMDLHCIDYLHMQKGTSFVRIKWPHLSEQLILFLEDPVCCDNVARLYLRLMKTYNSEIVVPLQGWVDTWLDPIYDQLKRIELDRIHIYHDLLCKAVQIRPLIIEPLFSENFGYDQWVLIRLKCIKNVRNIFSENNLKELFKPQISMLSFYRADPIRIAVLKVLVEWHEPTEFFTKWEFTNLLDYYQNNACNQNPSLRKEISDLYKVMIERLRASRDVIETNLEKMEMIPIENRTNVQEEYINELDNKLNLYKDFLRCFIKLLIANIAPNGNFYRRNLALELLRFIMPFIDLADWNTYWKADDVENLKQHLLDSNEMNKKKAINILYKFGRTPRFNFDNIYYYYGYFREALFLASDTSIKLYKSNAAAYMFNLSLLTPHSMTEIRRRFGNKNFHREDNDLFLNYIIFFQSKLNAKFNRNRMNLRLYGILSCLRFFIHNRTESIWNENYANTYKSVFAICYDLFNYALIIVSESVSEVHLIKYEETDHQMGENTKELIFAWRTIKEVTQIFSKFALLDMELTEHKVLQKEDHHKIGECFRNIFIQAKHMGVFDEAYSVFRDLCECYWKSVNADLRKLPKEWLQRGLNIVSGTSVPLTPFSDRAGTGFLIKGILTTDPSPIKGLFHLVMKKLFEVAEFEDEGKMVNKMHALIILRYLITDEKFSNYFVRYVQKTVKIALNGMKSLDWGVRNSSSLLFSILVKRLFGENSPQNPENIPMDNISVKVFYSRYPELYEFLVQTLGKECDENSLILNSVLFLFSKFYPTPFDLNDDKIQQVIPCIRKCLQNPSVETRKLAARASMALVSIENFPERLGQNFTSIASKNIRNNEFHGLLLEIWYILEYLDNRQKLPVIPAINFIASTIHVLEVTNDNNGFKFSHNCVSLYMDILSFLFRKYDIDLSDAELQKILKLIAQIRNGEKRNLNITNRKDFEAAMITLNVSIQLKCNSHDEIIFDALRDYFQKYMIDEPRLIMKTYCLHFILLLHITCNEDNLNHPSMWILGDLEVPESVKDVTNSFSRPKKCDFLTHIYDFMEEYLTKEFEREDVDVDDECFVLNLLILPYYPCVLKSLQEGNKQKAMDMLINFCRCYREDVISALITCISVMLSPLDSEYCSLKYGRLLRLLRRSAEPEAAPHRRLSVCQFLLKCKFLYYKGENFLNDGDIMRFSSIVLTLLEDQESRIRTEISALTDCENTVIADEPVHLWKCTPERSRLDFLKHCCEILPEPRNLTFMLGWIIRDLPDKSNDEDVFQHNELNRYAENVHYIQTAGKVLFESLWNFPFDQSLEGHSISIKKNVAQ